VETEDVCLPRTPCVHAAFGTPQLDSAELEGHFLSLLESIRWVLSVFGNPDEDAKAPNLLRKLTPSLRST